MKYKIGILGIPFIILLTGCEKYWDEHYGTQPETVSMNMWDAIQKESNLTSFVQYVKEFHYDTLFLKMMVILFLFLKMRHLINFLIQDR